MASLDSDTSAVLVAKLRLLRLVAEAAREDLDDAGYRSSPDLREAVDRYEEFLAHGFDGAAEANVSHEDR